MGSDPATGRLAVYLSGSSVEIPLSLDAEPSDANEPMLPTDSTDPSEQMERKEFLERHDSTRAG